jgi:hypothetical protein
VGKKRYFSKRQLGSLLAGVTKFILKSQLLTLFLTLFALGFWAGTRARPAPLNLPYDELFENLSVLSYRETPSDSSSHFVVELTVSGRVFSEYDLDQRTFAPPPRGRDYRRSISGTRYRPLHVRGHVDQGFWLELPEASARALLPEQFSELYQSTLGYMKPIAIATTVLGTISGYSIGYRMATWSHSLSNSAVQERVLATPGIGGLIAREAWRRVLLEPVVMGDENESRRFAAVQGAQRVYTNFFRLALNDSDSFIPREAARLDTTGRRRESRAMLAFVQAARRAAADTCDLVSEDFAAIEDWASILDRRGHWAVGATPPGGEERVKYFGTLAWYGLAPPAPDQRRIWVGPRILVREGGTEGFVVDDILLTGAACPTVWSPWLDPDSRKLRANAWTAQWIGVSKELAPVFDLARGVALRLGIIR